MQKFLLFLISLILSSTAMAEAPTTCSPSSGSRTDVAPQSFNNSNNLIHSTTGDISYQAEGEKVIIHGRILDKNCKPIIAKIYIWQANKKGDIQYLLNMRNESSGNKWIDLNFAGTGITTSDSAGNFSFITIKPGTTTSADGRLTHSHINIKVEQRPVFLDLYSKIYFPTDYKIIEQNADVTRITAISEGTNQDGYQVYSIDDLILTFCGDIGRSDIHGVPNMFFLSPEITNNPEKKREYCNERNAPQK